MSGKHLEHEYLSCLYLQNYGCKSCNTPIKTMQKWGKHLLITLLHGRQNNPKQISQIPASNTYKDLAQYLISQSNEPWVPKNWTQEYGNMFLVFSCVLQSAHNIKVLTWFLNQKIPFLGQLLTILIYMKCFFYSRGQITKVLSSSRHSTYLGGY